MQETLPRPSASRRRRFSEKETTTRSSSTPKTWATAATKTASWPRASASVIPETVNAPDTAGAVPSSRPGAGVGEAPGPPLHFFFLHPFFWPFVLPFFLRFFRRDASSGFFAFQLGRRFL